MIPFIVDHFIHALWASWFALWLLLRPAKVEQRSDTLVSRLGHLLPGALAFALIGLPNLGVPLLEQRLISDSHFAYWAGVAAVCVGLGFAIWARLALGHNWSWFVAIRNEHEFISSGPYGITRHPIYSGLVLAFVGSALALGELRGLLAVLLIAVSLWRKLRKEEAWLLTVFSDRYRDYMRRVKAIVPMLL